MLNSLKGRSVVVTGGSKGIGRGIARVFARSGVKLTIVARNQAEIDTVVEEMNAVGGVARGAVCDVTDMASVQRMIDEAAEAQGGLDILCVNAGIFPQAKMVDMSASDWDHVMATNLSSTFYCVKAAIPHFEKQGKGRVILTSSITGPVVGFPGWTHYAASKAGQLGFMKSAALELARYNTTINAVMPGNIRTEGLEGLGEEYLQTMANSIPFKRLGDVEDIGNAALFFASDEAGYITGQQMIVDGGQILPESLEALESI